MLHIEQYKGLFHMAVVLVAIIKVHAIDRKLGMLEKRVTNK